MNRVKEMNLSLPPVLVDLYYDLKDRRLLPLIALLLVATLAMPFLLRDSGSGSGVAQVPPAALSGGEETSQLTVVPETPGLRDYRKRLAARNATNPFKQRFTAPQLKGTKLGASLGPDGGSASTTTSTSTTTGAPPAASGGDVASSPPAPGPVEPTPPVDVDPDRVKLRLYTPVINVRIVHKGKATVRKNVLPLTRLPGKKVPAVIFMGVNTAGKVLLLVSSDVRSVFGDAKCALGSQQCDMLEVEKGFPTTFVYGAKEKTYRINVTKVDVLVRDLDEVKKASDLAPDQRRGKGKGKGAKASKRPAQAGRDDAGWQEGVTPRAISFSK